MATASFTETYFIHAPAAKIYAHLSEPPNYMGLSPLVTAVDNIHYLETGVNPRIIHYESVETFRFLGVIKYDNRIRVALTLETPNRYMISVVNSPFGVCVMFEFRFVERDGGTEVTETISAQMPFFVRGFVVSQARAVQQHRIRELKRRMETDG